MFRPLPVKTAILAVLPPSFTSGQIFDIDETLDESRIRTLPLVRLRPLERIRDGWHKTKDYMRERARIDLGISYTLIAQQAVNLGDPDATVVGSVRVQGNLDRIGL